MPTRILYWNIRDFARNKIDNPNARKRKRYSSMCEAWASQDRFSHILWLIAEVQPHIIVVVETETAYDAPGRLVRGNGGEGARTLLAGIRNVMNDNNWMLAPPLQTGPNEAVSVMYNSFRRFFTGPYRWPGGFNATAAPSGGLTGNYPNAYHNRLPQRNIPAGAQYNAGLNEYRSAARVNFNIRANIANAGNAVNYNGFRAPYMTTFCEVDGGGTVVRNLSLFSIHSPASFNAYQYLRNLADNEQIVDNIGADEVRVVLGDFNVNLLANDLTPTTTYNHLRNRGYTLELRPLAVPPVVPDGYRTYYATHLAPVDDSSFWSRIGDPEYYPGYGYIPFNFYAIDNFYTQYGNNQNPPVNNNLTVMNPVAGSPFDFLNPPPGATTHEGVLDLAQEMANPPIVANPANNYVGGLAQSFRGWEGYAHIYSVSDHLSLAIDI